MRVVLLCVGVLFASCSIEQGQAEDHSIDSVVHSSDSAMVRDWVCQWQGESDSLPGWLDTLGCPSDYALLEGDPLAGGYGQVRSVKFVYSLDSGKLWWINSNVYDLHFDFAKDWLGWSEAEHNHWDHSQYQEGTDRDYVLGSVNRYEGPGVWALELFPGDDLSTEHLQDLFFAVDSTTWFGPRLRYFPSGDLAESRAMAAGIPFVTSADIYGDQRFQVLNPGEAYGTLVRVAVDTLEQGGLGRRDIVFTNGIPSDLPLVAGIVTTEFQTPLSHVNVLSRNRGTPNMVWRNAWNDSLFRVLEGKLVHLRVTLLDFVLEAADTTEAQAFWDSTGPGAPPDLPLDTSDDGLVDGLDLDYGDLPAVGAKAANFGQLASLARRNQGLFRVPEGAFAIPFVHYRRHMIRNHLDPIVDSLLADARFILDANVRKEGLAMLRARIVAAPLDSALRDSVIGHIRRSGEYRMRFRSSTNAEDLEAFNGAGLYDSFTGELDNLDKPVDRAVKQVWASLWNFRAFEEREYFGIDQERVAMGVLVHRGFPDEEANGVALTRNIYKPDYWGFVVDVQAGDVQVVDPPEGVTCDQFIYYPFDTSYVGDLAVQYLSRSSLTGGDAVLSPEEIQRLGDALLAVHGEFYRLLADPGEGYWDFGMDVEFKLQGNPRELYIKQARPLP